jgi:uncharacterized membrane protein SpoIIM required for sporulation
MLCVVSTDTLLTAIPFFAKDNRFSSCILLAMREVTFVRKNQDRWKQAETWLVDSSKVRPDELAEEYVALTDDLAFSKAQYRKRLSYRYLNQLVGTMHSMFVRTRRESWITFQRFIMLDVPNAMIGIHTEIKICLIVYFATVALGFAGCFWDDNLARSILGNGYVDMTLSNISAGNPNGVYSQSDGFLMFLQIFFNNLFVSVYTISYGLIVVLGPIMQLIRHGILVGVFHGLFFQHGDFARHLLGVYIHGAFELSELVVACAAGLAIGRQWILPGTLPRKAAFISAARSALIVLAGMIPFIFAAALLESYVTRFEGTLPLWLNLFVIVGSFFLIWWYVWLLPIQIKKRYEHQQQRVLLAQ